jgi:hypothetical protein
MDRGPENIRSEHAIHVHCQRDVCQPKADNNLKKRGLTLLEGAKPRESQNVYGSAGNCELS